MAVIRLNCKVKGKFMVYTHCHSLRFSVLRAMFASWPNFKSHNQGSRLMSFSFIPLR
jgi:hypothetical protein